jgi:choline dehydrogenase-like flavoprotein
MHLTHLGPDGLAAYDVVIVGTSFAALPIVEALGPSRRVLLIDGGAPDEQDEARELTRCDEYGHFADGHWSAHWVRAIGGTSVRWSGVVGALHADDLQGGRGRPAWPLTRADLDASYAKACRFLARPAAVCAPPVPFGPTLAAAPLSHDTPRRLRDEVLARTRPVGVDLLSRHTAVRLVSNAGRSVAGLVVTDPARVSHSLRLAPRQVLVLACGGLGNAQMLLEPGEDGVPVGNESGLVGRFLMEHPHVVSGDVLVKRAALPAMPDGFGPGLPAFRVAADVMAEHDLLSCSLAIQGPVPPPDGSRDVQQHFASEFGPGFEWAQLYARAEQEPAAGNRVELLPDTTWAGTHRLRTHCSFSSRDLRSIEVSTRLAGEALLTRRVGVVRLHNRRIYRETFGGGHTMGTTRMGASLADSVCDANLRVHGYANLYLAGSSVFPTGGAVNPTLTIVALSYRLGAHLETRLANGGSA